MTKKITIRRHIPKRTTRAGQGDQFVISTPNGVDTLLSQQELIDLWDQIGDVLASRPARRVISPKERELPAPALLTWVSP